MDGRDLDDLLLAHLAFGGSLDPTFDERVLGRDFSVPRASVRASLARLVENGVIARRRRVGTVPTHSWRRHDLLNPANDVHFSGTSERRFSLRSLESVRVDGALADRLHFARGATVTRIHRLTLQGSSVQDSWVVWSTRSYEDYTARLDDLGTLGWPEIVGRMTGLDTLRVRRASTTIQASAADADLFEIDRGTPLNFTDLTIRTPDGVLIARGFVRAVSQRSVSISEALVPLEGLSELGDQPSR